MTGEVLLQLESAVRRACLVVSGVPIDETVRITVTVHPGAAASTSADAAVLFDALEAELRGLGGLPRPAACGGRYRGTGGCMADGGAPRDHNVLVAVEDATQNIDQRVVDAFRRFPSHVTVPVVQGRARNVPSPALARNIMLRYRPGQVGDLVPDLLEQARVGSDGFRVFISYRHDDCAQAASDIFHRLAEERFAVFLDRFVGAPGQDFVARIMSELFDKSCLLVLETPNVTASPWVLTEIATARAHRLGLLVVDLPGSGHALPIGHRHDCGLANSGLPLGRTGTLDKTSLDGITDFVRRGIAPQGARRRRWQRRVLRHAISLSGVADRGTDPLGHRVGALGSDYLAVLSARPPGAGFFKRAQQAASLPERPLLFGPLVHQLPRDAAVTDWLAQTSGVRAFDEGVMLPALRALSRGLI